jgi:hypothetical protein
VSFSWSPCFCFTFFSNLSQLYTSYTGLEDALQDFVACNNVLLLLCISHFHVGIIDGRKLKNV